MLRTKDIGIVLTSTLGCSRAHRGSCDSDTQRELGTHS